MNYQQAVQYIESLIGRYENRPGLERIEKFLACHNFPQHAFTSFHVGGTNGKGSTVAMLDSILRASSLKIGRFTGPHLLQFNERFHVDGVPISNHDFAKYVSKLKCDSERFAVDYPELGSLSWFELLTALAFFYFAESNVDIAVIEVGLGGRFDATNVLERVCVTGITNIALDHERILGSSIQKIAMEKAGIIKPSVPVVSSAVEPALSILKEKADELKAEFIACNRLQENVISKALLTIKDALDQKGTYQYTNALMALYMVSKANLLRFSNELSNVHNKEIALANALQKLKDFYWPGRFQFIKEYALILDGAHNPAGIKALRESLEHLFPGQNFHFIFSCYADKDGKSMLEHLLKRGDTLYLVDLHSKRSLISTSTVSAYMHDTDIAFEYYENIEAALIQAKRACKANELIVATGSLAIVRGLAEVLGWATVEDGLRGGK